MLTNSSGHDVVRLMELMGHGHGFDEQRTLKLFGQEDTIT